MTTCLFETYVKSNTSEPTSYFDRRKTEFDSYVKLNTSEPYTNSLFTLVLFETYAKSNTSKTNVETLEFDRV